MIMSPRGCIVWFLVVSIAVFIFLLYMQDISIIGNIPYKRTDLHPSTTENSVRGSAILPVPTDKGQSSEVVTGQRPVKVIIMTYMRSGSSFTGDLIQQHPDVFYVYEPLHITEKMYQKNATLMTFQGGIKRRAPTTEEELRSRYFEVIDSYFNCRLLDVNLESLTQYHMIRSLSTKEFYYCVDTMGRIEPCLQPLNETCHQSKVRAVKVIRINMTNAGSLMEMDPDVKVIHLLRDPRGTYLSRRRLSNFAGQSAEQISKDLCHSMAVNIGESLHLHEKFPGRIATIRYEDLVDAPIEATKHLYRFLGLAMTPNIEAYIWNITYSGLPDDCVICTTRSNASLTAYKWREKVIFEDIGTIQRNCENILDVLGYRIFLTEKEVQDNGIASKLDVNSSRLKNAAPPNWGG